MFDEPSICTKSYFGVIPFRTYSSCNKDTGVFCADEADETEDFPETVELVSSLADFAVSFMYGVFE